MSDEMTVCNDCGDEIKMEDAESCSECGVDLCSACLSANMLCADCEAEMEEPELCDGCGCELMSYDHLTECPQCFAMVGPCCWDDVEEKCRYCVNGENEQ